MDCLIQAAAVVLDTTPEQLVQEIGHDGQERVWSYNPPFCYRGFHIQEIQNSALKRGKCLYLVERHPCSRPPLSGAEIYFLPEQEDLFFDTIHGGYGIALGEHPKTGVTHAGVLRDNLIWEPDGVTRWDLHEFRLRAVYLIGSK